MVIVPAGLSGGELLELRLLDTHLLDTFGSKTIARHEIDNLLESSSSGLGLEFGLTPGQTRRIGESETK